MDSVGGARIAVDQIGIVSVDSIEDQLRELRRERDALRRENRILKIAVAELERVSERDTLTPLFNRRYFLTAIHQRIARFERHNERAAVVFVDENNRVLTEGTDPADVPAGSGLKDPRGRNDLIASLA